MDYLRPEANGGTERTVPKIIIHGEHLDPDKPRMGEEIFDEAPASILGAPRNKKHIPNNSIRRKIAIYFTNVYNKPYQHIMKLLPEVMPRWGKSRIVGGGDKVSTLWAQERRTKYRDSSFVRYEVAVDSNPRVRRKTPLVRRICYGELHEILECVIPPSELLGTGMPTRHLLALVSDSGAYMDAALTPTSFTNLSDTTQIIALASVSSVCGRFLYGTNSRRWAIVDRSCELARPIFSVDDDD
ncbi:uncharacterized protein EI90DRAFT_2021511 [Cantharellus anzutake]|uniref:uncharacterized protein n=1 Tax=Cantharellus anzutake TaxID=1750568 RepID=UPI0019054A71|nr:uncharacterized protein EI90DRAFT_2021511 [Cantharellus anzutake]KAF8325831.1 hypothetical protein EI90DRAFT_2021511 [Cantharellus anzutake]